MSRPLNRGDSDVASRASLGSVYRCTPALRLVAPSDEYCSENSAAATRRWRVRQVGLDDCGEFTENLRVVEVTEPHRCHAITDTVAGEVRITTEAATSDAVMGIGPRRLRSIVARCQPARWSGSAGSNRGPLVPQTSTYLAPTNRVQRRVPSSRNGWNEA